MTKNKIYFWASDYSDNTGEGRLCRLFLNYLEKAGIENRPIISGNFLNQPCTKLYNLNPKNLKFKNAQEVEERGFFIGIHTHPITKKQLLLIEKAMFSIDKFI